METDNKKQLASSTYGDNLATNGDSRASSNIISKSWKRYPNKDGKWYKPHLRCDI